MNILAEQSSARILKTSEANPDETLKDKILKLSPFAELGGASCAALYEIGTIERFARKHKVAQQGEPVKSLLILGSGRVRLARATGDRVFPIGHRGPGETVGETALGGATLMSESALILDEVEALVLPILGLRKLLATDEDLRKVAIRALAERHIETERRLESLLLRGVEARLIDFLLASLQRWGQRHEGGQLINAPFTHADIALLVGSTRETVTLLLGKLKRAGLIDFERRRVVVRDREALSQYATSS